MFHNNLDIFPAVIILPKRQTFAYYFCVCISIACQFMQPSVLASNLAFTIALRPQLIDLELLVLLCEMLISQQTLLQLGIVI